MDTLTMYESFGCLHDMFRKQAKATPDAIAVVENNGESLTFQQLDAETDLLANSLVSLGVKANRPVGIYMERCVEYVIAYIAILKAGGGYMPVDLSYPETLLQEIFTDSNAVCIITKREWSKNLQGQAVVELSAGWQKHLRGEQSPNVVDCETQVHLDDLAYIVYSSGTTGKPKGIMCPHRGAVFSYTWRHLAYPFSPSDRVASNVFFVWEMLRPLLKGIPLYVIPDDVIYDPILLTSFIRRHSITRILLTPSLLESVLDFEGVDFGDFRSLRIIWLCGEVVTTSLLERCIKALPSVQFLNLYSVSECHDVASSDLSAYWTEVVESSPKRRQLEKRKFCPVGKLLPGVEVYILDEQMNERPTGVPGEIYVGGPTLALGYLNRPSLNETKFIERPAGLLMKGRSKLYKTGDWGIMLQNRVLEICGRCDSMVKIRGYSIEIQAVESALIEIEQVNTCVVLLEGDEGIDKHLVAYVVPKEGASKRGIRSALKQKLPMYMIPSYFIFLNKIPVVATSGKLDKGALAAASHKRSESVSASQDAVVESELPITDTERSMVQIWSDILQFRVTDTEESFFDLGGHSLLATRLVSKLREVYSVKIDMQTLFTHSTVAELSQVIDAHQNDEMKRPVNSKLDLRQEVKLNAIREVNLDIQLRAFWRSSIYKDRWNTARVLLTGATGFLGAYILRDLLLLTKVYCLIRKYRDVDGKTRLWDALNFYELLKTSNGEEDKELKRVFERRVYVITGDVALLELGMSEEDYTYLSYEIDSIIHAAAYVNLLYPYSALKGTNVYGTRNILLFSTVGKIKPVHHISTNSVFPNGKDNCKEESSKDYGKELDDGYSQSKWVAEQLVMSAIESGLPASIYRIGNISGDRDRGGWNPSDFNLLVLRASIEAEVWPDLPWQIEMTPVDFVSSSIVKMTQNLSLTLHKVFHLVNPVPVASDEFYKCVVSAGYKMTKKNFSEWCTAVENLPEDGTHPDGYMSLRRMLDTIVTSKDPALFSYNCTFDQTNFDQILKSCLDGVYPVIERKLVHSYLAHLRRRHVITKPRQNHLNDLDGVVILVTGSSSGIGKAIAKCLAEAGAKVCLAARRRNKLAEIKQQIAENGGHANIYEMDVTDRYQFTHVVQRIEEEVGPIYALVNNAGVMYYTHVHNVMMDDWDRMIDVNCRGVTNGIGCVLPHMLRRAKGHIINTSSDAGRRGFAGLAVYSGTKFFVEGLSQGLRHEVKGRGIKVTCIQPGDVHTELLNHTNDPDAKAVYDGSEACRILDPGDVAKAVLYALTQPEHVGINEILIEPRENPI